MLGLPAESNYDLRFRLLGIPVRVHWFFWIVAALLGPQSDAGLGSLLTWVGCVFLSIVVHEMGHGLTSKLFGYRPHIVLYGMGGACYSEGERQTPGQRLAVIAMGPGAGFLLAGACFAIAWALVRSSTQVSDSVLQVLLILVGINVQWSILNLLPVWPLDGGQITGVLLGLLNRRHGARWGHVLSMLVAGVLAFLSYQMLGNVFLALFFGMFALMNFQILQALHQQSRYTGVEDDADWWRR
jgi:membrane-associated protease RseP (regulator of RpoE activity)